VGVGLNTTFNRLIPDELIENDCVIKFKKIIKKLGAQRVLFIALLT